MQTDMFTEQHAEALEKACGDLSLKPTPHQQSQLIEYLKQLLKWNKTYNLTAIRDPHQALIHHIFDSLAVVGPIKKYLVAESTRAARLLDVGSGAGLPGVVIATMVPEVQVTCVDTVEKKMAFVTQIASVLKLNNLTAIHQRVERLKTGPYDLATSRAFSSLKDYVQLTEPLIKKEGFLIGMKGKEPCQEIEDMERNTTWCVDTIQTLHVPKLDAQRCLIWMKRKGNQ